jgi:hypothetical protein
MNTQRGILSIIRKIDEPCREVVISRHEPVKLESNEAELFKIVEIAVQYSGGRLRLAFNEEDNSKQFVDGAAHFLKLDEKRIGRDIELYGFMGDSIAGWQHTLAIFLEEILFPFKSKLPKSYAEAGKALRTLGESVYPKNILQQWRNLF